MHYFLGPHRIQPALVLAPMAGVTDRPFRNLCRRLGAGLAVSEMTASDPALWETPKSRARMDHRGEVGPIVVQIAGADPRMMADAARHNVDQGAQAIDINMGCPAKKVCRRDAGSALMADESLVAEILEAVVGAVEVPVTLKMRTGVCARRRNAVRLAQLAQACGITALAVHGRTREQRYEGQAEYDTIAAVRNAVDIPVLANGDIGDPHTAARVLQRTGAHGLMIGRAAQGNPWIFREIAHFLATGGLLPEPSADEVRAVMLEHLDALHELYGERRGVRVARKHIGWYCAGRPQAQAFRTRVMALDDAGAQRRLVDAYFSGRLDLAEAA